LSFWKRGKKDKTSEVKESEIGLSKEEIKLKRREARRQRRREKIEENDKLSFQPESAEDDFDDDFDGLENSENPENIEEFVFDLDPKTRKLEEELIEYNESEDDKFDEESGGLNIWARAKRGKKLSKAQIAKRILLKKQRLANAKFFNISYSDYLLYVLEAKNKGCLGVHSMGKKEFACISPILAAQTSTKATTTVATTTTTTTTTKPTTTTTTTLGSK